MQPIIPVMAAVGADAAAARTSLRYERSFQDPLLAQIAFAIVSELQTPTAAGKLLAETLAASLAARLVHGHTGRSVAGDFVRLRDQGLDRRRLRRVTEYIAANLDGGLTIAQLAKVACVSRFHFARAFKTAVGRSPHQYVNALGLERAKEMLTRGDQSLLDITVALSFSSQANFTRAFRQGTGMTPGQYRRSFTRAWLSRADPVEQISEAILHVSPTGWASPLMPLELTRHRMSCDGMCVRG